MRQYAHLDQDVRQHFTLFLKIALLILEKKRKKRKEVVMVSRLLSGLGLFAVVALTSAQSISDLEALLEAARVKEAAEAANVQPQINVEDGNMVIRVGKDADAQ